MSVVTWIKLDDKCPRHPKVSGLTDRAFRWWVIAMCYASEFLTDGELPGPFIRTVPARIRAELVNAGLWLVESGGHRIHDYLEHQTTRADVERERERARLRRSGGRTADVRRTSSESPRPDTESRYREQRTEPPSKSEGGTRAPVGGLITPPKAWGLNHGPHVPGFCDWQCLLAEDFGRFAARLGSDEAALAWAKSVRASGVVPTGKPWTFWNAQFDAAHGAAAPVSGGFSAADWAAHAPGGAIDKKLGIS